MGNWDMPAVQWENVLSSVIPEQAEVNCASPHSVANHIKRLQDMLERMETRHITWTGPDGNETHPDWCRECRVEAAYKKALNDAADKLLAIWAQGGLEGDPQTLRDTFHAIGDWLREWAIGASASMMPPDKLG